MIEIIIKEYFEKHLEEPVFFEHVPNMPKRFIMIDKTGGSAQIGLKSATVALQSYAESLYEAAKLNESVKEVVAKMIQLDSISSVQLNSDYNFTDTETKRYRYQAVFDFIYY